MSPDLANWLGIAWLVGCGSFALGWWWRGWHRREQERLTRKAYFKGYLDRG